MQHLNANVLSGGLAPGAIASNIAGNVVQNVPGSLVGSVGEVLGNPVGAVAELTGIADPGSNLTQAASDAFGESLDEALEEAQDNVIDKPIRLLGFLKWQILITTENKHLDQKHSFMIMLNLKVV